jgi:hypothetical protein
MALCTNSHWSARACSLLALPRVPPAAGWRMCVCRSPSDALGFSMSEMSQICASPEQAPSAVMVA